MLSNSLVSGNSGGDVLHPNNDRNPKKVRFKDNLDGEDITMDGESNPKPSSIWKDKLLGISTEVAGLDRPTPTDGSDYDFELLEGDVNTTIIDRVSEITFSDRIKNLLFKEMELTMIVKLLVRNIGYNAFNNRILSLWKPVNPIRIMDTSNGYFLVKFQAMEDYNRVLSQGLWIVYGQYLTVQPWIKHFSPTQPYPRHLYKRKIIEAIGSLIGKVVKLDVQTDNQTRGRFARLAVYINLDQPLISQVFINGTLQRIEYEALRTVCFTCSKYGHVKDMCSPVKIGQNPATVDGSLSNGAVTINDGKTTIVLIESKSKEIEPAYGPWMLVEKRQSRWGRGSSSTENLGKQIKFPLGRRFSALMREEDFNDKRILDADFSKENDKRKEAAGKSGHEDKNLLGCPNGLNLEKDVESGPLGTMYQMSKVALDKHLGKRPISQDGPVNGGQRISKSINSNITEAKNLEKIKAHYNPVFDESEGFMVPIFDNTLDPGPKKKDSGDSRKNRKTSFAFGAEEVVLKLQEICVFL
ncbi:hypothetical protein J1N35_001916 [Gossypium stocksii]|uniref:DUF4283 domain-containing protein n=1 Tax=Gossypium stocksii TaxID=47602 RepID=A0A9D3WKS5_9ROSI|nr:hypothetical protein J1N35_001916 [Gossypium stocksii]